MDAQNDKQFAGKENTRRREENSELWTLLAPSEAWIRSA